MLAANFAVSSQTAHGRTDTTKFASATRGNLLIEKKSEKSPFKAPLRQYIANPTSTVIHPVFLPFKTPTTHSQHICALINICADEEERVNGDRRQRY